MKEGNRLIGAGGLAVAGVFAVSGCMPTERDAELAADYSDYKFKTVVGEFNARSMGGGYYSYGMSCYSEFKPELRSEKGEIVIVDFSKEDSSDQAVVCENNIYGESGGFLEKQGIKPGKVYTDLAITTELQVSVSNNN